MHLHPRPQLRRSRRSSGVIVSRSVISPCPGSTSVSGVGFGVSPKRTSCIKSLRKRDAFADGRDARAPRSFEAARAET